VAPLVTRYGFRRGLLERVELPLSGLLAHGEALFRHAPILELTVTDWEQSPAELAKALSLPALAQLTHLHLPGKHAQGEPVATALAQATHLKRLTSLWLEVAGIGDRGFRLLANSPHLRRLTELHLEYNRVGPAGVRALAPPCLTGLRHLYLGSNDFGPDGARA